MLLTQVQLQLTLRFGMDFWVFYFWSWSGVERPASVCRCCPSSTEIETETAEDKTTRAEDTASSNNITFCGVVVRQLWPLLHCVVIVSVDGAFRFVFVSAFVGKIGAMQAGGEPKRRDGSREVVSWIFTFFRPRAQYSASALSLSHSVSDNSKL